MNLHLAPAQDPEAHPPSTPRRLVPGGSFLLDRPDGIPSVWGVGERVVWASGESLMIVGSPGVGKSTLAQQLVLARLGLARQVLGMDVQEGTRVLYLACDRPPQIARSFARMVRETDRELLDERLAVWKGPPPADFARDAEALLQMASSARADTVVVDSLKDCVLKLTDDEMASGWNRARQRLLVGNVELLELHHQTKRGAGGIGKPTDLAAVYGSAWLTAGAGSVFLLHGDAGDPVVRGLHLKQPGENCGPLDIVHDHHAGRSRVHAGTDPAQILQAHGQLTAAQLASALYIPDNSRPPKPNEVEKARRVLDRLVREGHADRHEPHRGGPEGTTPTSYTARP